MKKFLVGLFAVNGLALLIFLAPPGNTVCAQETSNKINMLEIVISNLIARVEALEKKVGALEKNTSAGAAKSPKKEAVINEPPKTSLANGFEDIGYGFFVRNVRFSPFGTTVLFTGEIANKSEKNYRFAKFMLEIYDDRDLLVKKEEFNIPDLPKEAVKSFEAMLIGIETGLINRYVIKAVE